MTGSCTGTSWSSVASAAFDTINQLRGSSAKDIWLLANNGVLQRWDGSTCPKLSTGVFYSLTSLWLDRTGAPWIGGKGSAADYPGAILRYIP